MLNRTNQRISYWKYLKRKTFQSNKPPYYFAYGRTALKYGLINVNLQNTTILVPEYICETITKVFQSLNISVVYFPVNDDLSPQWNIVEKLYTDAVKSILMVHYFGIPQAIDDFIQFTKRKNIVLIEDNSHGCFGEIDNQMLGTFGAIGIASPRKTFPILNGGILYSKTKIDMSSLPLEPQNIPKAIIKNLIGKTLDFIPKLKSIFLKNDYVSTNYDIPDYSFDLSSYQVIEKAKQLNKNRVEIYKKWLEWSKQNNVNPLYPNISTTIAPMCFPLIFTSRKQKQRFMKFCVKENIAAFSWPDLPQELRKDNNTGLDLFNRIICLPIYDTMNSQKKGKIITKRTFEDRV